jgi:hypothetical protein
LIKIITKKYGKSCTGIDIVIKRNNKLIILQSKREIRIIKRCQFNNRYQFKKYLKKCIDNIKKDLNIEDIKIKNK